MLTVFVCYALEKRKSEVVIFPNGYYNYITNTKENRLNLTINRQYKENLISVMHIIGWVK